MLQYNPKIWPKAFSECKLKAQHEVNAKPKARGESEPKAKLEQSARPKACRENELKAKFEQNARSFFEFSERECFARSVSLMKRTSLIIDKNLYAEKGG